MDATGQNQNTSATTQRNGESRSGQVEPADRRNYGSVPGDHMSAAVYYISFFVAFALVVASWFAFAQGADAGFGAPAAPTLATTLIGVTSVLVH